MIQRAFSRGLLILMVGFKYSSLGLSAEAALHKAKQPLLVHQFPLHSCLSGKITELQMANGMTSGLHFTQVTLV